MIGMSREIRDPARPLGVDYTYVAKYSTPGLLFEALMEIGPPLPGQELDVTRTRLATFILKKHKPDLLLVDLVDLDVAEHRFGPNTPQAVATLEKIDGHIGELLAASTLPGSLLQRTFSLYPTMVFCPFKRTSGPTRSSSRQGS